MRPLERVPAVRRIETDRENLFAVEIVGEFTSGDAENLYGLLEGAYALHPRLDLLVRLLGVESVDLSGIDNATVRVMREEVSDHVARCAVIGESARAAEIETLLTAGAATELRHFTHDDEAQAWDWLAAREMTQRV